MKSLLLVLLLALLPAAATAAPPPVCAGSDLLAEFALADPAAHAEVLAEARAVANGEALFWRIERRGLEPSYLLGTAHVTDPRVTTLTPGVAEALRAARTVALELRELRDARELTMASLRHASLMVLPQGQSLWDLVPDGEESAIRDNVNLPPGTAATLFGYQPWVVAAMLSVPLCETARKAARLPTLDEVIAAEAGRGGIEIVGLETVAEQLGVLAAMPRDLQVDYLLAAARLGPTATDLFATLVSLYEQRLVTAYMPLMRRLEPLDAEGLRLLSFVEDDMIRRRNRTMAARAESLLASGDAFIAVGALHLPGSEGLVELLRQRGYKVTPLN